MTSKTEAFLLIGDNNSIYNYCTRHVRVPTVPVYHVTSIVRTRLKIGVYLQIMCTVYILHHIYIHHYVTHHYIHHIYTDILLHLPDSCTILVHSPTLVVICIRQVYETWLDASLSIAY